MSEQPSDTTQAVNTLSQLVATAPMPNQGPGLTFNLCQQALAVLANKALAFDAIQQSDAQEQTP